MIMSVQGGGMEDKMKSLHENHRQRIDMKAETSGLENLPEHEILEQLLFAVIPRGNTNEIARALCLEFGGIGNVLKADVDELRQIDGVGYRTAVFIHNLPDVLGVVERSLRFSENKITSREDALEYVKTLFYGKVTEHFYMISLTSTGGIIKFNKMGEGTTDEVKVYARNVAARALRNGAHSVIIAHNHPGGTAAPSLSDKTCTEAIERALDAVGIKLYDSIIVAGGEAVSLFEHMF